MVLASMVRCLRAVEAVLLVQQVAGWVWLASLRKL